MKEKISIIVPVYNVEKFLRKCVNSLINQTYKNIEIILVDDGSPDNCGKICDAFAKMDKRIKVVHQKNGGLCAARNAGLREATGDYIGFVDSDDWVSADMYEYLLENILKYDAEISACRYYRVTPNCDTMVRTDGITYIYNRDEAINELITNFTIRAIFCNKLFKKELFNNIKFPEGHVFEGNYLMHKIFQECDKIVFLPDAKYYYFNNEDSIVNAGSIKNQSNYVISKIVRYNDLKDDYPKLKNTMMLEILVQMNVLIEICNKNKKKIKENKELLKQIDEFYKKNYKYIVSEKLVNKLTLCEFSFYHSPNRIKLFFANIIRVCKKILSKLILFREKIIAKLMRKKTKAYNPGIIMDDLTNEDRSIFDQLHKCELKILDEMVRICEKHNITYFLYGGTLLGAVRHKGFIPWDDDIDIIMPRKDYEKFKEVCKKELGKEFYYQDNQTDKELKLLFSKIRLNDTYVEEEKNKETNIHQGIFIDILPLDVFPEVSNIKKRIILAKFNALNSACQTGRPTTRSIISLGLYLIYKLYPNSVLQRKRNKYIQKWNNCKSKYVCSFGSHYRPIVRRVMKKEWFEEKGIKLEFEGKKYSVPGNYEGYLVHLFGNNYMKLPPEKDRVNHFNFYNVSFDTKCKGEDKNGKRKK